MRVDPHSYLGNYGLAEVAFERQDLPAALACANRSIEAKPDFGDAYVLLGRIELAMGDKQKAMEVLEHAATLSPSDASLYFVLGRVYNELGKRRIWRRKPPPRTSNLRVNRKKRLRLRSSRQANAIHFSQGR